MIGPYPYDTDKSSYTPYISCDKGNITAATEYNSDATKMVDRATDSGFEGGKGGGSTTVEGMFEEAVEAKGLHIGEPPKLTSE